VKKTLVTGAAGFIGSNVVRELLAQNVEVRALIKPGENVQNLDGLDLEKISGDLLDRESLKRALKGCDTLFHLAAIYAIWLPDRKLMYDVNLKGSSNMLWTAFKADVEKVVFTSSIAAIGLHPGKELSNEDTPFNLVPVANDYILSKYLSQVQALDFAENGLPLVVVNPAFPFGEGDIGPTPTGRLILEALNPKVPVYMEGGLNIVDVRDVARGHILAAQKGRVGESYLLSNLNISNRDFFGLVARLGGAEKSRLYKMPTPIVEFIGMLQEVYAERWSRETPSATRKVIQYASKYAYFDNTKSCRELGLEFSNIEDSLRLAIDWFRKMEMV